MKVRGVGRDAGHEQFVSVALSERPTDDQLRSLHEYLRGWPSLNDNAPAASEPSERDKIGPAIADALSKTQIEFSALSTTGVYIFGSRKSIEAVNEALNAHAVLPGIQTQLRHWQEECGKLHARLNTPTPSPSEAHRMVAEEIGNTIMDTLRASLGATKPIADRTGLYDAIAAIIANAKPVDSAGFVLTTAEGWIVDGVRQEIRHDVHVSNRDVAHLLAIISRAVGAKS